MERLNTETREETLAIIIAESEKYILSLREKWEKTINTIERKDKARVELTTKAEIAKARIAYSCSLSVSKMFCNPNCDWWRETRCTLLAILVSLR